MHTWKVVPLSSDQRRDVREEDILNDGDFRKCSTYRGGGGYDKFPEICEKKLGRKHSEQFVVQLYGCPLDCPYCYVTREGVWGDFKRYTSEELIEAFITSEQQTFHLMGGAPALQIEHWHDIIWKLDKEATFHSDLMLIEKEYSKNSLKKLKSSNCLYAISVKGLTQEEFQRNTRKYFDMMLFLRNLENVLKADLPIYFTFTGIEEERAAKFIERLAPGHDWFCINLIDYEALPYVDNRPWGTR